MIKILSIIGTRPQYIKVAPFNNFCINNNLEHVIIDTSQHYSDNVSKNLIYDLNLNIKHFLKNEGGCELDFITSCLNQLKNVLLKEDPDFVLIYGDTNSTLAASLACYKMKIPYGHVEAGLRCGDFSVPEEVNRTFCDMVSSINFCSSKTSLENIDGVVVGDFEYELLNQINPPVTYGEYGVMTIHRQKNTNKDRLTEILNFCGKIDHKIKFFVHHRTKPLLKNLTIPDNVCLLDSQTYSTMVKELASSRFILTDSGGINKIAPFFGKKALIFRDNIEWKETELSGYVKRFKPADNNQITWLLTPLNERQKRFYMEVNSPSKMVYNEIINYLRRQ